jgi:hypothetical protein
MAAAHGALVVIAASSACDRPPEFLTKHAAGGEKADAG